MVNPIELFPGALVKSKDYGIMKVLAVGYEKIIVENKYAYEEEFFLEEVKPIRLTPKIVKKLGFRRKESSSHVWAYYKRGAMEIWFKNGKLSGIWWKGYQKSMKKAYVHNLQRLTLVETRARIDFSKLLNNNI